MGIKELTLEDLIAEIIARIGHEGKLCRQDAVKQLIKTLNEDYGGAI